MAGVIQRQPAGDTAFGSPRAWAILLAVLVVGLAADLWSKSWSFDNVAQTPVELDRDRLLAEPGFDPIPFHRGDPVLPFDLLKFRLVLNPGAVFGIGANHRWFFIVFTVIAMSAGVYVFGRYTGRRSWIEHAAIALVLAGGLGNLYDRMAFGRVRDFLHALPGRPLPFGWTWPGTQNDEMFPWVFNIADVLLLVGMVVLMLSLHRQDRERKRLESNTAADVATDTAT
ncbi:MAG: signal peptidase II [Phycisphaerales bacterium]|nr:signal peptidase II [Phycisphaerae bacterium]NNF42841.1 signal peptidase II [Phycisphaerales bacterium]NNM25398.1 signal peptidase II [Phycisphaerales bacterium]